MVRRAQGDAPRRRVARERTRPVQLAPGAAQRQHGRVRAAPDSDAALTGRKSTHVGT